MDPTNSEMRYVENYSKLLRRQAEFCKLFTNEHRLRILTTLMHRKIELKELNCKKEAVERTVTEIKDIIQEFFHTETSQALISQHLGLLRKQGAVSSRREGNQIYYKIADDRLMEVCDLVRSIVIGRAQEEGLMTEGLVLLD